MSRLRVLRVYHEGGDASHRARDHALVAAGVDVTLVSPVDWPGSTTDPDLPHRQLAVTRAGDVNRHAYADPPALQRLVQEVRPDVLDLHEEPVSLAARQWLHAAGDVPVVMYTAQNLDKRWPPPFAQYERRALARVQGFYPCSAQAGAVLRGKGYSGVIEVLPLGVDSTLHAPGDQRLPAREVVLGLVGRLVPEKGVLDAVQVLAAMMHADTPSRLIVMGSGPEEAPARALAAELRVSDRCEWIGWSSPEELAAAYQRMHVVLVPSRATARWVEQFGRVITEGSANGAVPVGYASGSIPEVVGGTGVVVREGDVTALAQACVSLLNDHDRWGALREAGLQRAKGLGWGKVAARQADLYRAVLHQDPPPLRRPGQAARAEAAAEFGPPATGPSGARPFALPVLRNGGPLATALTSVVDVVTRQR
jgi:glycosyltransferase involved in cell wall biosynthesis